MKTIFTMTFNTGEIKKKVEELGPVPFTEKLQEQLAVYIHDVVNTDSEKEPTVTFVEAEGETESGQQELPL